MEDGADIDRLPIDLLAHIFVLINSFTDLAQLVFLFYHQLLLPFWCVSDWGNQILICGFFCLLVFVLQIRASSVCRKWKEAVKQSLARRHSLSFAGLKMDDNSTARLVGYAYSLKELDMYVLFVLSVLKYLLQLSISDWETISFSLWICRSTVKEGLCPLWICWVIWTYGFLQVFLLYFHVHFLLFSI